MVQGINELRTSSLNGLGTLTRPRLGDADCHAKQFAAKLQLRGVVEFPKRSTGFSLVVRNRRSAGRLIAPRKELRRLAAAADGWMLKTRAN